MKHTPGPWRISPVRKTPTSRREYLILEDKFRDAKNIAMVIPCVGMADDEVKANAVLIKAAPDMLEALISAREHLLKTGITYDNADAYNIIDDAIKKATDDKD